MILAEITIANGTLSVEYDAGETRLEECTPNGRCVTRIPTDALRPVADGLMTAWRYATVRDPRQLWLGVAA